LAGDFRPLPYQTSLGGLQKRLNLVRAEAPRDSDLKNGDRVLGGETTKGAEGGHAVEVPPRLIILGHHLERTNYSEANNNRVLFAWTCEGKLISMEGSRKAKIPARLTRRTNKLFTVRA